MLPLESFRIFPVAASAAFLIIISSIAPVLGLESKGPGAYKIMQTDLAHGPSVLWLSKDFVSMSYPNLHLIYRCLGPECKVIGLNTKLRRVKIASYDTWPLTEMKDRLIVKDRISRRPTTRFGLQAVDLTFSVKPMDSYVSKSEFIYRNGADRSMVCDRLEITQARPPVNLSSRQIAFLRWIYAVPQLEGVLLRRVNVFKNGKRHTVVDTGACLRTRIPDSEWKLPDGYTRVSRLSELRGEKEIANDFATMMGDLMLEPTRKEPDPR